jgi:hypothetical protein
LSLGECLNASAVVSPEAADGAPAWHARLSKYLGELPRGEQSYWGIPFNLGTTSADQACLIALHPGASDVRVPLSGAATHICVLHIANFPNDRHENAAGGNVLAEYIVRYRNGREHVQPVRMRFEINCPCDWGEQAFAAQPASMPRLLENDPTRYGWGWVQTGVSGGDLYTGAWLYALELPDSKEELHSLTLRPVSGLMGVLGVTLYNGPGHPLRHIPRRLYKLVLPAAFADADVRVEMDMGIITRTWAVPCRVDDSWLVSPESGLGAPKAEPQASNEFLIEATGALGATLSVKAGRKKRRSLDFGKAFLEGKASTKDGSARIELLDGRKTWVHVTVTDTSTGKPTPTRIHFCGPHGEYIPPYGHHQVVNDRWFEDYGGDLQLGAMSFAYVPGRFQIELPEGDVYVEISKGFEYAPVRHKVTIKPGQRELKLGISCWTDRRRSNWVTADTHVHFISPETAWLEGQAEGLNLINLLASQWGKLFTNVADISGELSGCSRDDTLVWVGTENRNHLLGHISMLGTKGDPVFPMCTGGPEEAWIGDPEMMLLSEWADACREREGVVIRPHFPTPICEEPVNMLLGKIDGAELRNFGDPDNETLDHFCTKEWYRYLNCGCRVAAVGGTDKMSAGMPVGAVRTYARIDPNEGFTFENWGKAVRAGRTFTTSGPLIDLTVEGRSVGEEVRLPAGGGSVEVRALAECVWPIHKMEIVANGRVVAATSSAAGERRLSISETVRLDGSCWIAARCSSRLSLHPCWPMQIGAHTSPIYIVAGDEEVFSASDANYMLTLIDGGLTYLETLSVRYDEERHFAMKAIFERARSVLHGKMHRHGARHSYGGTHH